MYPPNIASCYALIEQLTAVFLQWAVRRTIITSAFLFFFFSPLFLVHQGLSLSHMQERRQLSQHGFSTLSKQYEPIQAQVVKQKQRS